MRSANASQAVVSLAHAPGQLSIQVQGNGHGMAPGNGYRPGHGLIGIRERVRLYYGEMSISAPAGGGFLLRVSLPLGRQPL
jgi:signal transduction histidine kinase